MYNLLHSNDFLMFLRLIYTSIYICTYLFSLATEPDYVAILLITVDLWSVWGKLRRVPVTETI